MAKPNVTGFNIEDAIHKIDYEALINKPFDKDEPVETEIFNKTLSLFKDADNNYNSSDSELTLTKWSEYKVTINNNTYSAMAKPNNEFGDPNVPENCPFYYDGKNWKIAASIAPDNAVIKEKILSEQALNTGDKFRKSTSYSGKVNYFKTHYEKSNFINNNDFNLSNYIGKTLKVRYNNMDVNATVSSSSDGISGNVVARIGNVNIYTSDAENTGEEFLLYQYDDGYYSFFSSIDPSDLTLKISYEQECIDIPVTVSSVKVNVTKKIDPAFENASDWNEQNPNSSTFIKNKPFYVPSEGWYETEIKNIPLNKWQSSIFKRKNSTEGYIGIDNNSSSNPDWNSKLVFNFSKSNLVSAKVVIGDFVFYSKFVSINNYLNLSLGNSTLYSSYDSDAAWHGNAWADESGSGDFFILFLQSGSSTYQIIDIRLLLPSSSNLTSEDLKNFKTTISLYLNDNPIFEIPSTFMPYGIAYKNDIPTTLCNPYSLAFTGAATGTYDGSKAKTVNIPSGSDYNVAAGEGKGSMVSNYPVDSTGKPSAHAYGANSHAEGSGTTGSFSDDKKGELAHAEGGGTTASGTYSHAEGGGTRASGDSSHTEGSGTTASGQQSHAEGGGTTASGDNSHAEGGGTTASANYSHAEGYSTKALGSNSHSECNGTTASGDNSHAEGCIATASGDNSHAEGFNTKASSINQHVSGKFNIEDTNNIYAEIIGNGISDTKRSNARTLDWNGNEVLSGKLTLGTDPTDDMDVATKKYVDTHATGNGASGGAQPDWNETDTTSNAYIKNKPSIPDYHVAAGEGEGSIVSNYEIYEDNTKSAHAYGPKSHAEGEGTTGVSGEDIGYNSHAEGSGVASNDYSHAEGSGVASNDYSHAEGASTTASGYYSHAEGSQTEASGDESHAEGIGTVASGENSHAEGRNTNASGTNSHAEGCYTKASSSNQHVSGKYNIEDTGDTYAEIIGNGTDNNTCSNARTLDWQGNEWLAGALTADGGVILPSSTSGSTKKFKITVDDTGALTATEVTE